MLFQRASIVVALAISMYMLFPPTSPLWSSPPAPLGAGGRPVVAHREVVAVPAPSPTPVRKPLPKPVKARGIIVSGYTAAGSSFPKLLEIIDRTELNSIVLDIKNESGEVSWLPRSQRARAVGAGVAKLDDPRKVVREIKRRDIYLIGRIVVFKDPILARVRPDLAVRDATTGDVWRDRKGLGWGDPYSPEVWAYNMDLAREAVALGFDEIQFDYIRFPTDGDISRISYPHKDIRSQPEVIRELLADARTTLNRLGVYTSADIFGFAALTDDPGIGQQIELIAPEVDYVSLMLYPSHYSKGNYNLADPEKEPYKTISLALADAKRRTAGMRAKHRPWLQAFSLDVHYSPREVRAQIQAAEDAGIHEWLLWNARNVYQEDALKPDSRARRSSRNRD